MDRKTKIESMLSFINNGIYHVNDVTILADNFEIDGILLNFYMYVNVFGKKLKFTVSVIPLIDIHSIEGFNV